MTSLQPPPAFLAAAAAQQIEFEGDDLERLGRYLSLLLEANAHFNLTAVRDPDQAWERHVLDSLTLLPLLGAAKRVIDVGSGGGAPGVPLAIVRPEVEFVLLEATGKKARFLEETTEALGLENVVVVHDRAETVAHDTEIHRGAYDLITARAVGPLNVLLELTVPFAKVGGLILAIKGQKASEEIDAAKSALHALHAGVIDTMTTPTGTIVVIEKQRKTPKIYPRRPGEPKRVPL